SPAGPEKMHMNVRPLMLTLTLVFAARCSGVDPAPSPVLGHGTAGVGSACTAPTDCKAPLNNCNADPGGQCTRSCTTQADCAAVPGAVCETDRPGNCYKLCTSKADCPRDGYDCLGGPNPEGHKWCDVVPPDAGH